MEKRFINNQKVTSLIANGNNIFAGTNGNGVYVTMNNGASWIQRNEGLFPFVTSFCILNNDLGLQCNLKPDKSSKIYHN